MNVVLKVVFNIKTVQVKDIQHYPCILSFYPNKGK